MDPLSFYVAIAFAVTLVLQGLSCFLTKRPLSIGLLDLLFAAILLFAVISLSSGALVIATEFGTLLFQGYWTERLVRASIAVGAILPGLCWYRIRTLNNWSASRLFLFSAGLFVGLWAASRVFTINPSDPESLRVYTYDILWPPLIVWLTMCFAGSALALVKAEGILIWIAYVAALLTPLASFALHFSDLADSQSRPIWIAIERISFFVAIVALVSVAARSLPRKPKLFLVLAIAIATLIVAVHPLTARHRELFDLLPLAPLILILAASIVVQFEDYTVSEERPGGEPTRSAATFASSAIPMDRARGITIAVSLPVIALCAIDLFCVGYAYRVVDLAIIASLWVLLAERLAEGALDTLPYFFKDGVLQFTIVKSAWSYAGSGFSRVRSAAAALIPSSETPKWAVAIGAVLVPLLVLALLTSANEIFNYKKIVVEPFQWTDKADSSNAGKPDISALIPGNLINAIGRLQQDLQPELVLSDEAAPGRLHKLVTVNDDRSLEVAVAKSEDIHIASVTIPLGFFARPFQSFVRSALGIRVVEGSVGTLNGQYVILANSSNGDSWIAPSWEARTQGPVCSDDDPPKTDETQPASTEGTGPKGSSGPSPKAARLNADRNNIDNMIDELAFDVASSDPWFVARGFTTDWEAFDAFRRGLDHWRNYEREQEAHDLTKAICFFRAAVRHDKNFSAAFYRLGVALQHDHRPDGAVGAFQASVAADSDFMSGASMEASTLYDFNTYYPDPPAVLFRGSIANEKQIQAARIWSMVAQRRGGSIKDKRLAFYGMCVFEYYNAPSALGTFYLPYYYCSRANALTLNLWSSPESDPQDRKLQAFVLHTLGMVLEWHSRPWKPYSLQWSAPGFLQRWASELNSLGTALEDQPLPVESYSSQWKIARFLEGWACSPEAISPYDIRADGSFSRVYTWGGPESNAALERYRQSLDVNPGDTVVRCDEANALAYSKEDSTAMTYLKDDADTHFELADSLLRKAQSAYAQPDQNPPGLSKEEIATRYYEAAIREFETAISLDRASTDALNGYAYGFWQWKMDSLRQRTTSAPSQAMAFRAERLVREAIRIARLENDVSMELTAMDTLGEVLLAQGRTGEANEVLEQVLADKRSDHWDGLRETTWDLAKAKVCDAVATKNQNEIAEAIREFAKLQKSERDLGGWNSEFDSPDLDVITQENDCPSLADTILAQNFPLVMRPHKGLKIGAGCVLSVDANVSTRALSDAGYALHVWGPDVENKIALAKGGVQSILVSFPAEDKHSGKTKNRHLRFFAQVEDGKGEALSSINSLDVYESSRKSTCRPEQITLKFDDASQNPRSVGLTKRKSTMNHADGL